MTRIVTAFERALDALEVIFEQYLQFNTLGPVFSRTHPRNHRKITESRLRKFPKFAEERSGQNRHADEKLLHKCAISSLITKYQLTGFMLQDI